MGPLGRTLVIVGAVLIAVGLLLWLGGKVGLGRLPGDLTIERNGWSIHIPIVTSIVISVVLTVVLNLLFRGK
ncbi:MAG: DUF2905 domain-containing protein [Myxococcota bacterium]